MSYSNPAINEATGSWEIIPTSTEIDYNRKVRYTPSLKRYRIAGRDSMGTNLQYSDIPDAWFRILITDATNKQKAQLEITRLLYKDYCAKKFTEIDSALKTFPVDQASSHLLVSVLSSTFPAKTNLKNRDSFYVRVAKSLDGRGLMEPGLLAGLE